MKSPIINVEEKIGKVVGRTPDPAAHYDGMAATAEALMPRLPFPEGVYRFLTFEAAGSWMDQHIPRAARKKSQEFRA